MKKIRVFTKLKFLLLSGGIVLSYSGCSQSSNTTPTFLEQESKDSSVDDFAATCDASQENLEDCSFDYFSSDISSIEEFIQQDKIEEAKRKIKDVFITGVDFIFYDEPIGDIYFDDLTDAGKSITMDSLDTIDTLGEQIAPNWKDNLSEKYRVVADYANDIYLSKLDEIKNYLGEENYQALGEIKNQVGEDIIEGKDHVKERVKSWYQKFKSSN